MVKKFAATYLGGYPKESKLLNNIKLISTTDGIAVLNDWGKAKFTIDWKSIVTIDIISETDVKSNPSFTSALGALSGNIFLAAAGGRNVESTRTYFLVIGYKDASGFETKILFQCKKVHKAMAYFIAERSKHIEQLQQAAYQAQAKQNEKLSLPDANNLKNKHSKLLLLSILGWILVPYIMIVIYVLKHSNEIFQQQSKEHVAKAVAGGIWALIALIIAFSGEDSKDSTPSSLPLTKETIDGTTAKNDNQTTVTPSEHAGAPNTAVSENKALKEQEKKYKSAVRLMDNKKFEEARKVLEEIPNYRDSIELQGKIDMEIAKLQVLYDKAVKLQQSNKLEQALTAFQDLGDFKDSVQRIVELENNINAIKYEKARKLKDSKKYEEAQKILTEIKDYKNSAELLELVNNEIAARMHRKRLANRKFINISADTLFDKMIWSQNAEEYWDKRYNGKYVKWKAKFVRKPLLLGKLIANSGEWGEVHCLTLDETMDQEKIDKLEKWQKIKIEGKLLGFGKKAGANRAEFTLTECIIK